MYVTAKWRKKNTEIALIVHSLSGKDPFDCIFSPASSDCVQQTDVQATYLSDVLDQIVEKCPDIKYTIVLKNQSCVLTEKILENCIESLETLEDEITGDWALCTPSGLSNDGENLIASYYSLLPNLSLIHI